MPIELHLHAAGPLDYGVHSDGVLERLDDDGRARRASGPDGLIHVSYKISGALLAERERHRRLECENGERSDGSPYVLEFGTARLRQNIGHRLVGGVAAKGGDEAGDERVQISRSDVHVRRIVLRSDGDSGVRSGRHVAATGGSGQNRGGSANR